MNGYLTRRGDINTFSWKRRFFVLEADSNMLSYSVQEGGEMKALLAVTSVFLTHHSNDKKRRCLRIKANPALRDQSQTRLIIAYAETEDETDQWFTALQEACSRRDFDKEEADPIPKVPVEQSKVKVKGPGAAVKVEYTTMEQLSKCSQQELLRMVTNAQEVTLHARQETDRMVKELRDSNEKLRSSEEQAEQYRVENEKLYSRLEELEKQLKTSAAGGQQTATVAAGLGKVAMETRPRRRSDAEAVMGMLLAGRMDDKSVGDFLRTLTADDGAALATRISERGEAVVRGRTSSTGARFDAIGSIPTRLLLTGAISAVVGTTTLQHYIKQHRNIAILDNNNNENRHKRHAARCCANILPRHTMLVSSGQFRLCIIIIPS